MKKFSVVIPLYNKGPHIERALMSVLKQTFQNFEIIVVDDGSTDNSAEIVKTVHDTRIHLIQQENAGVSAARNRGIKESKADLIAFLDADDEWLPTFLETILRLNEKFPEAGLYASAFQVFKIYNKIVNPDYKLIPPAPWEGLLPNYFLTSTLGHFPISSSAVCVPKRIFLDIGEFRLGVRWGEDSDMWGRIALKYPIAYSRQVGSIYHQKAENRACQNSNIKNIKEHCFVVTARQAIRDTIIPINMLSDLEEYIACLQITVAIKNVFGGNNKQALEILMSCKTKLLYRRKLIWILLSLIPSYIFIKLYNIVEFLYYRVKRINTVFVN